MSKLIKKSIHFFMITVFILLSIIIASAAENQTYGIPELNLSMSFPNDFYVYTRDTDSSYPFFAYTDITADEYQESLQSNNTYLEAYTPDDSMKLTVNMTPGTTQSFKDFSYSELDIVGQAKVKEFENDGYTVSSFNIVRHAQTMFIKFYMSYVESQIEVNVITYYTCVNNQDIYITMNYYEGPIITSKEVVLTRIIINTDFNKLPQKSPNTTQYNSFTYTSSKSGVSFTVPKNWVKYPLHKDREFIETKFISLTKPIYYIMYGCKDVWDDLSNSEKAIISRENLSSATLFSSELESYTGIQTQYLEKKSYGDYEYYQLVTATSVELNETEITLPVTILFRIDNGYYYNFQFFGSTDSPMYSDFEKLLTSAEYAKSIQSKTAIIPTDNQIAEVENQITEDYTSTFGIIASYIPIFIISLILTFTVYSAPILIYRYKIIEHPIDKKKAKKITIIYGIISFFIMSLIFFALDITRGASGAIFFWSWVNYKLLTNGYSDDNTENISIIEDPEEKNNDEPTPPES